MIDRYETKVWVDGWYFVGVFLILEFFSLFVCCFRVADSFSLLYCVPLKKLVFREMLTQEIFFAHQLELIGLHWKCDI